MLDRQHRREPHNGRTRLCNCLSTLLNRLCVGRAKRQGEQAGPVGRHVRDAQSVPARRAVSGRATGARAVGQVLQLALVSHFEQHVQHQGQSWRARLDLSRARHALLQPNACRRDVLHGDTSTSCGLSTRKGALILNPSCRLPLRHSKARQAMLKGRSKWRLSDSTLHSQ